MNKYEWIPSDVPHDGTWWSLHRKGSNYELTYRDSQDYFGLVEISRTGKFYSALPGYTFHQEHKSMREAAIRIESEAKKKAKTEQASSSPSVSVPALPVGNAPKAPSK